LVGDKIRGNPPILRGHFCKNEVGGAWTKIRS